MLCWKISIDQFKYLRVTRRVGVELVEGEGSGVGGKGAVRVGGNSSFLFSYWIVQREDWEGHDYVY